MIEIEKGIPLPEGTRARKDGIYPLRDMEVGDSFLIPGKGVNQPRPYGAITRAQKATGYKFTTKSVVGGLRIWRVS